MNSDSDMKEVVITHATKEMMPQIIEVIKKGYNVAYKEGSPVAPPDFPEDYEEDVLSGRIRLFVAIINNIIVGSAQYVDREGAAFISQMTVAPSYRKKGVARKLVDFLEKAAKKEGFCKAQLTAMVEKDLPRYYEKLGYIQVEVKKRPRYTLIVMEKRL